MTTSSSDALPARSPRPLIVTSTWRAPAWTAASVLAVASPRSLWQWTLTVASRADEVDDPPDERTELGRDRVADGVRDVDGRSRRRRRPPRRPGAGSRGRCATRPRRRTRSRRRAPSCLAAVADPADGLRERLLAVDAELVLEVDVARRDEDVEVRPLGDADRLDRPLRVAVAAAGEGRDGDPALRLPGDPAGRPRSRPARRPGSRPR